MSEKWIAIIYDSLEAAREDGERFEWATEAALPGKVGVVYKECEPRGHTGLPGSIEVSAEHARLIAAAPALLAALHKALPAVLYAETMDASFAGLSEVLRRAVADAEGTGGAGT